MGLKALLAKQYAKHIHNQDLKWLKKPIESQHKIFSNLITKASNTVFGTDHGFKDIESYDDFKRQVQIRDYEQLSPYINQVVEGKENILWPQKPIYFAKTSGTTSGVKYIPITKDSIGNHINSAKNALLAYIHETGNASFVEGKLIFLSGSPELSKKGGINIGRLSGIVNHHVPGYLRTNQLPTYATNCIEDWETKLDKIIEETQHQDMRLISGIPPWMQMYFDRLISKTGKSISTLFPNFNLMVYGGVNFEPYRLKLEETIGKKIPGVELFPASEGFFAYQNSQEDDGLLLLLNSGIFYEFIPADRYYEENPPRITIENVLLNVNYVLIINSNAGLWGYNIGDTVKFVSLNPYKIRVTGRIKHFISAFGEHVIGEEVEKALQFTLEKHTADVVEYTVAPQVNPIEGLPYHEWLISFGTLPTDLEAFAKELDFQLCKLNIYYTDLISGNILRPIKITVLPSNAFIHYMKSIGKLGGQNKVPRLSNDRKIADELVIVN